MDNFLHRLVKKLKNVNFLLQFQWTSSPSRWILPRAVIMAPTSATKIKVNHGKTVLNSASGQKLSFCIADSEKMSLSSTELVVDVSLNLNSISDVENYIIDISENLSNLSQKYNFDLKRQNTIDVITPEHCKLDQNVCLQKLY